VRPKLTVDKYMCCG